MQNSKWILLAAGLSLQLTACNLPKPEERLDSDTGATFIIQSFDGGASDAIMKEDISIPDYVIYNFRACMIDMKRRQSLATYKFQIAETQQESTTDTSGCMTWSEKLQFNYFAKPANLKFVRTIIGTGAAKGSQTVEFAVNPWEKSEAIDLSKKTVPHLVEDTQQVRNAIFGQSADGIEQKNNLWISAVSIDRLTQQQESREGIELRSKLTSDLQVQYVDINGDTKEFKINNAKVNLDIQLIHQDIHAKFKNKTVVYQTSIQSINLIKGQLVTEVPFTISKNLLPLSGQFFLGIKVTPLTKANNISAFEGIFDLGDASDLLRSGKYEPTQKTITQGTVSVQEFLSENGKVDEQIQTGIKNSGNTRNPISLNGQVEIGGYQYTTLGYTYQLDSNLNLSVSKKVAFQLSPSVLSYGSVSNNKGTSSKLADGVYLLRMLITRNPDVNSTNPYVSHIEKLVSVVGGDVSAIVEFNIHDLKALKTRSFLYAELKPVLQNQVQVLASGDLIPANGQSLKEIEDRNSQLTTRVYTTPVLLGNNGGFGALRPLETYDFNNILIGTDSKASVNTSLDSLIVRTSNEDKKILAAAAKATDDVKEMAAQQRLDYFNVDQAQDLTGLQKLLNEKPSSLSIVPRSGMSYISYDKSNNAELSAAELTKVIESGKINVGLGKRLCGLFIGKYMASNFSNQNRIKAVGRCLNDVAKDSSRIFNIIPMMHVKKLAGYNYAGPGMMRGLSVSRGFSASFSQGSSYSESKGVSASLSAGHDLFKFASIGVSGSMSASWSNSTSQGTGVGTSVSESSGLSVQELLFDIKIAESNSCVAIKLNPMAFDPTHTWKDYIFNLGDYATFMNANDEASTYIANLQKGVLICNNKLNTQPVSSLERFFLISDESGNETMDSEDAKNHKFFVALRGQRDYSRFVNMLSDKSNSESGFDSNRDAFKNYLQFWTNAIGSVPGLHIVETRGNANQTK